MISVINLAGKSFDELMGLFFCEVIEDDDFYDVIAGELARDHRCALEVMLPCLSNKRLRAGICGLGMVSSIESQSTIKQFLNHEDDLIVAAAIDALRRISPVEWPVISLQSRHASPYVRGAALRYAKAALGKEALPILMSFLHDKDSIVREGAIDEMDGIISVDEAHLIEPYLDDSDANVRLAAKALLDSFH